MFNNLTEILKESVSSNNIEVEIPKAIPSIAGDSSDVMLALKEYVTESTTAEIQLIKESTADYITLAESVSNVADLDVVVVSEASGDGFFNRIIAAIRSLWAKIRGIFDKFITKLNSMFLSDKKFVEKYEKTIEDKDLDGHKISLHTYTTKALDGFDNVWNAVDSAIEKEYKHKGVGAKNNIDKNYKELREGLPKFKNTVRALIISQLGGQGSGGEENEYKQALVKCFRSEDTQEYEDGKYPVSVSAVLSELKSGDTVKKAEKAKKSMDDHYKEYLKTFTDYQKKAKDSEGTTRDAFIRYAGLVKKAHDFGEGAIGTAMTVFIDMMKARQSEFRKYANSILSYKEKK